MPPSLPSQSASAGASLQHRKKNLVKKKAAPRSTKTKEKTNRERKFLSEYDPLGDDSPTTGPLAPESSTSDLPISQTTNALQTQMPLGMYGSPMYGGYGMSPMMMPGSPFSGLYQVLFGVQNIVFSLGQAVQVLGTNQQALQQAFDSLVKMFDHAVATFHELRALEAIQIEKETEEQKNRRRRLKAVRWAILMGGSWLVYKLIHRITRGRRRQRLTNSGSNGFGGGFGGSFGHGYGSSGLGGYMNGMGMYGGGYSPGGASVFGGGGQYLPGGGYY